MFSFTKSLKLCAAALVLLPSVISHADPRPLPPPAPVPHPPIPPIRLPQRVTLPVTALKIFQPERTSFGCFYTGGTAAAALFRGAQVLAGYDFVHDSDCPATINHVMRTAVKFQKMVFPPNYFNKAKLKFSLKENQLGSEFVRTVSPVAAGNLVTNKCPLRILLPLENWESASEDTFPAARNWVDAPKSGLNNRFEVDVTVLVNSWHGRGGSIENLGVVFAGKQEDLGPDTNDSCVSLIDDVRIEAEYDAE